MSIFKRLKATVTAQMDDLVSQIENHDAIIESALTEAKVKVAKTKVRKSALKRERESLCQKLAQQKQQVLVWGDRAVANKTNQKKALTCMQRRKIVQQRVVELEGLLRQISETENRMQRDIEQAEKNIQFMSQKREMMMARETAADSMQVLSSLEACSSGRYSSDLNKTFDRWEEQISIQEVGSGFDSEESMDEFEQAFASEEEQALLFDELDQLMNAQEKIDS